MKILILGATGMIGHRLWSGLSETHDVSALMRRKRSEIPNLPNIKTDSIIDQVDVLDKQKLTAVIERIKPEVVFNCIGVVKQLEQARSHAESIELNSLFPHILAQICLENGARMIQFSSDCIFDGKQGNYKEEDFPSASDLYGRSKALGEVNYLENVLTLRTSFIGREIFPHGGLIHWFESNAGRKIKGFSRAIYSGLPAVTFVRILNEYILPCSELNGLYHLSSDPINKYDLLMKAKKVLNINIDIEKDEDFVIDRSLDSSRLKEKLGVDIPDWNVLIEDLAKDSLFYQELKK